MMSLLLWTLSAFATDTWTSVRPGIDRLERTIPADPNVVYAVRADLSLPNLAVRATQFDERHQTTGAYAREVDALIAINGDWSDTWNTVGLSIGDGEMWQPHVDRWSYFACDISKSCTIDFDALPVGWTQGRLFNAIGANNATLMRAGAVQHRSGSFYDVDRHPRSALCLEPDGIHLWLVVVQGRVTWSRGMTWNETADLMQTLGCYDAAMLDGGGSSTLWVEGDVLNTPTDGSERVVANHLALLYRDTIDPACAGRENGRHCSGTVLTTCTGGAASSGDCAAYGSSCEEDGTYAYCVDARCPSGLGNFSACDTVTTFGACTDGVWSAGDCAAFGQTCEDDGLGAFCVDPRCVNGGSSDYCLDGVTLGGCDRGVYAETLCNPGDTCGEDVWGAYCIAPACLGHANGGSCDGDLLTRCDLGVVSEIIDCTAEAMVCDASVGSCVVPSGTGGGTPSTPNDTPATDTPGPAEDTPTDDTPATETPVGSSGDSDTDADADAPTAREGCDCATAPARPQLAWGALGVGALAWRRRRR
jgi:MYXO-CTERM domain-containing protein